MPFVYWLNVHEGDDMLILINHAGFLAPGDDVAEHAPARITHDCHVMYYRALRGCVLDEGAA
jgi:hypothetical protein